jgi:hypothetical protein
MAKLAKSKTGKAAGNVTVVDLGEDIDKHLNRRIDQKLKAAGVAEIPSKEKMAGPGYRAGGYRPGMFGHRPWYADRESKFGHAMGSSYAERFRGLSRPNLAHMAVGAGIGGLGIAGLMRVTPDIVKSDLAMVHSGLAFLVGLVPVLAKPNSYTLGVALPGTVALGLSIFNWGLDALGISKPALRGIGGPAAAPRAGLDAAVSARDKLAQVHGRMTSRPGAQAPQAAPARVVAQAV